MSRRRVSNSLLGMLAAGGSALRRYPGLTMTLYAVQVIIAAAVGVFAHRVLTSAFAELPVFDEAVDGSLPALIYILGEYSDVFVGVFWMGVITVVGYTVISWYLLGGLNAVLIERPSSRGETAQCFGVGGAATFFAYLRLALASLIPYVIALIALAVGFYLSRDGLKEAMTDTDVIVALAPAVLPAAILWWIIQTAVDYARIKLSRSGGSAIRALLTGFRLVFWNWRPLVHVLLYVVFFAAVSLGFVMMTSGSLITGAVSLLVVRQLVSLIRFAGKIICAGGQVELGMGL